MLENLAEKQLGLADHRGFQHLVEFGMQKMARLGEVDVAQPEPLPDEVFGEGRRLGRFEHPLDLGAENIGILQSSRQAPRAVRGCGSRSLPAA